MINIEIIFLSYLSCLSWKIWQRKNFYRPKTYES